MALKNALSPVEALSLILDQVDYTNGACRSTEMVGAVLDQSIIRRCRDSIAAARAQTSAPSSSASASD